MQGFNMGRYVPPDVEGTTSANKLHKKRASKLTSHGILTVRFEMPFPIWCSSCPKPTIIGQGVRFNAEKKKVGAYYSSPIWSFRFRHAACGGTIEMRTDPQNTAYIVFQGATKRDTGEDRGTRDGDEALVIMTDQEREVLRRNAFASLEKTIGDREKLILASERIDHLREAQDRAWEDPYAMNQKLRKAFRVGRKERERDEEVTEALREKMGLGIELVPEMAEDAQRAKLVDFGSGYGWDGAEMALTKPLFGDDGAAGKQDTGKGKGRDRDRKREREKERERERARPKADKEALRRKGNFVSAVVSTARLVHDPFLTQQKREGVKMPKVSGVKRKLAQTEAQTQTPTRLATPQTTEEGPSKKTAAQGHSTTLVEYDSD
ncbi:hypothetical protein E4U23_005821 [Claviceps purpurea]|nr:hypothetical protein E4U51_001264 [Claviceps purpurea]KAG6172793.1 hypothetical protein E4U11_002348 [Claviceps purpurea]KAG6244931.1 hypothetical protein E4U23_005821 [Claviceps purpurea]